MSRHLLLAAAQLGPISRTESRRDVVERLLNLLRAGHRLGCRLVVFPECALTAFFPHWFMEDQAEIDGYFEREMPNPAVQPLFDEAARLGVGFHLGYAELTVEHGRTRRFNTCILVTDDGRIAGKYRKIHLPGHADHRPLDPFQNLEKRYFEVGDLGFRTWRAFDGVVGMCICNDRRWPETYRLLGLGGAELILTGYNTPRHNPEYPQLDRLADFHHLLSLQAGAYQNGAWVVAAAKAGVEEGVEQIGGSAIVAPSGEVRAISSTSGDEVVAYRCDLDETQPYKEGIFHFARNRRIEHYGPIASQTAATPPERPAGAEGTEG